MAKESSFQSEVARYLRQKGCYVLVTTPGAGIPTGCPDIIFLKDGFWGAFECKQTATSKFQPLQRETLKKLDAWSYAKAIWPANWAAVRTELEHLL